MKSFKEEGHLILKIQGRGNRIEEKYLKFFEEKGDFVV